MELVAAVRRTARSRLIPTATQVCTLDYVAKMLGEVAELLEAIIYNDNNLT